MAHRILFALAAIAGSTQLANASDLLITEVVEGSSNNKAVEISNISNASIDLSQYSLAFYFNGNTSASTTINLSGSLAPGASYVVADNDADPTILAAADQISNSGFFNGDDAIVLLNGANFVDIVGQIGVDPGSEWGTGVVSTKDNTIARLASITSGDVNGNDAFDPAAEWEGFANNTFTGLGSFVSNADNGGNDGGSSSLEGVCLNCPDLQKIADATLFDPTSYYAVVQTEIDANSDRSIIKQLLSETIATNHKVLTYSEVWTALTETDEDPANSDNVILFYSGWSLPKLSNGSGSVASSNPDNWNREHSWPKSHGFSGTEFEAHNDIHHLRPTDISINSSRGNLDFDNSDSPLAESPNNRIDGDSFEPRDTVKGDVARMMFYMDTRYEGVSDLTPDLVLVDRITTTSEDALGKLCTLLEWHAADPVDAQEQQRNNTVYEYQGNRNPFIDNPAWVNILYPADSCSTDGGNGGNDGDNGDTGGNGGDTGGNDGTDSTAAALMLSGVVDGSLSGGLPKAVEIFVTADTDLAGCGIGSANNGGGSDGEEFSFPAQAVSAGSYIYLASEATQFTNYFGFAPDFVTSAVNVNGDDALELFCQQQVIDTFGDINTDGTGQPWEYMDGWAYRVPGTGANPSFAIADWTFSGTNELDGVSVNADADKPFPLGTHYYQPPELFISEYVEGSGNNKALEIYNPAATPVDLSGYDVQIFFNGNASAGQTISLSGTLAAKDVFVIRNSSADDANLLAEADLASGQLAFNGDDAITLRNGQIVIDSIGQIGVDPGSEWGSGDQSTQNNTLRRKAAITAGDTNAADVFDPSIEWDGFTINETSNIGVYGNSDGNGGGNNGGALELGVCSDPATAVSAIQGTTDTSPVVNESHVVEGVVTGVFAELGGFYLQQQNPDADPLTSEGLFIAYDAQFTLPQMGDNVRALGKVEEVFGRTQLTVNEAVLACGTGTVAATSIDLPLPAGFDLESLENMLITNSQLLTVSDNSGYARFGEVVVSSQRLYTPTHLAIPGSAQADAIAAENQRNQLILDDDRNGSAVNFPFGPFNPNQSLRTGAQVNGFTGVLDYGFNAYRVRQVQPTVLLDSNPRQNVPEITRGNVTVASFNVLNLFNGDGQQGGFPTSRGADTYAEYQRQLSKIASAIVAMDADIVGLMEIENDGFATTSAIAQLVATVNQTIGSSAYTFVNLGAPLGTDQITVGMLYKPAMVTPVGNPQVLTSANSISDSDGPLFVDTRNRPSLAQQFTVNASGADLVVNVNHLKSKGSSCGTGDDSTNGQGNCNGTRTRAAQAIAVWLATTYADLPVVIVGDLNAYAKEDPIDALQVAGYIDVARELEGPEAYSYVFNGQFGSLDYVLTNASAFDAVVDITEWHINADEPSAFDYDSNYANSSAVKPAELLNTLVYRASDHDPVLVSFDLQPQFVRGDWDGDGDVDLNDYRGLLRAIQTRQPVDMRFDLNEDGRITTFDARVLLSLCTRLNCAV